MKDIKNHTSLIKKEKIEKIMIELAEVMEVEPSEISVDTQLQSLNNWDSLAALSLVALIDQEFDVLLEASDLQAQQTLRSILELVNKKANANTLCKS